MGRYSNLLAELKRANIKPIEVAKAIGVSLTAYYERLKGSTSFKLADMLAIQKLIKEKTKETISLDYLFKYDKDN